MQTGTEAIEITGIVDDQGRLVLDEPLPITGPQRVRVRLIVTAGEIGEAASAAANGAAVDLDDHLESSFTLADGQPWPGGTIAGD